MEAGFGEKKSTQILCFSFGEKVAEWPDEGAEENLAINPVQPFQTHFLADRYFGAAESDQPFGPRSVAQR